MSKLNIAKGVELKESIGKGLGVFATKNFDKNEIIEECHLIEIPIPFTNTFEDRLLAEYRFSWPSDWKGVEMSSVKFVLPLGFGAIYNHSDFPNASWRDHPTQKAFQFYALRDINIGEEICTYYGGDDYWKNFTYIKKAKDANMKLI